MAKLYGHFNVYNLELYFPSQHFYSLPGSNKYKHIILERCNKHKYSDFRELFHKYHVGTKPEGTITQIHVLTSL